jgi:hypothetical protein
MADAKYYILWDNDGREGEYFAWVKPYNSAEEAFEHVQGYYAEFTIIEAKDNILHNIATYQWRYEGKFTDGKYVQLTDEEAETLIHRDRS